MAKSEGLEAQSGASRWLYVIGGLDRGFKAVDTAERYDSETRTWEKLPPLSGPRAGSCAVALDNHVYAIGGEYLGDALRVAERYDTQAGLWEVLPDLSDGRIRAAAVACEGFIYVIGGLDGTRALSSVDRFNPVTQRWEAVAEMQRARYACSAAVQEGRICVLGGELTETGMVTSAEVFDPKVGSWELLPAVRNPFCGSALSLTSTADNLTAFTIGGIGLSGQATNAGYSMSMSGIFGLFGDDLESSFDVPEWSSLPAMPTHRHLTSVTQFCGGAVAVGGKCHTFEACSNVEIFRPEQWRWEVLPPLPSPRIRAAVTAGSV